MTGILLGKFVSIVFRR